MRHRQLRLPLTRQPRLWSEADERSIAGRRRNVAEIAMRDLGATSRRSASILEIPSLEVTNGDSGWMMMMRVEQAPA
jgi:hypothetical protein